MKKVLIIDDEVDLCLMIRQFLSRRNYEVHIAHTLTDGINYLKIITPDVLILDNNLPDGMGWDAARSLHEKYPEMKITLISAYKLARDLSGGMDHIKVLEKPVSLLEIEQHL
ncbi:MAG: response regulator [Ferruginibacter sp.]